tara:strand:- start:408 stop:605 length:198 start_codon:yes stop_codon:yes gene_type:complete
MKPERTIDLVALVKRFTHEPHQIAALNMLQELLPKELSASSADWVECYYSDGTGIQKVDTIAKGN